MSITLENVLVCGADVNPDTIGINSLMLYSVFLGTCKVKSASILDGTL